ncbi:MAG TPA: M14 family zinc carboxypeptidase, partial [Longimicrobiales bacterium]|nr:M14 family zinc carboxypeptidase [Longimicrobiales bacterium]
MSALPRGPVAGHEPVRRRRGARAPALALAACLLAGLWSGTLAAQQSLDQEYTRLIREYTTEDFFLTPYVDHLPASATVPTPLEHHGYIVGAPEELTYPADVADYMRAVAAASPRVEVFTIGESEEGREMIAVVVADEATIRALDVEKESLARLADPRTLSPDEAEALIGTTKPIYYATGAIHSGETGSPEMLMELVYRLAVSEEPFIQEIRDGLVFMATPVVEVDGRAKEVDVAMAPRRNPDGVNPRGLLYWGKYVSHDNNRDNIGLSLALSRNILGAFLEYHPTVMHDLHESASYLYTSTGRGPYNAWVDPVVINEWARLAYKEVQDMTALGVPGIYTHNYYDGWAPNYMFWIANMRNAIGRFYETQG